MNNTLYNQMDGGSFGFTGGGGGGQDDSFFSTGQSGIQVPQYQGNGDGSGFPQRDFPSDRSLQHIPQTTNQLDPRSVTGQLPAVERPGQFQPRMPQQPSFGHQAPQFQGQQQGQFQQPGFQQAPGFQQQQQQPQTIRIDPNDMRQLAQTLQPQPQQRAFNLQEFRQQTGYPQIDASVYNGIFDPNLPVDQRVKNFGSIIESVVNHTLNVYGMASKAQEQQLETRFGKFDTELNPIREQMRETHINGLRDQVNESFPSLKQMGNVTRQAIDILRSQGFKPQNTQHAIQAVSSVAENLVKNVVPQFSLQQVVQQGGQGSQGGAQQSRGGMPQMATMITAPGGGAQGGGGQQQQKRSWDGIFES